MSAVLAGRRELVSGDIHDMCRIRDLLESHRLDSARNDDLKDFRALQPYLSSELPNERLPAQSM